MDARFRQSFALSPLMAMQAADAGVQKYEEGEEFKPSEDHQEAGEHLNPAGQQQEILATVEKRHDGSRAG